ncbi:hypothetical protein [Mucilaginibacter sp.]|uniref:hypothetical protein n=1 Tax=Mucilaginibacter sp. TaxID=1882438 RepID=UPI003AFFE579
MFEAEQLKQSIIQTLDQADEKTLRMLQAILQIHLEHDFWDDLPDEIKNEVEESIKQGERGEGITHEEMMKKYLK